MNAITTSEYKYTIIKNLFQIKMESFQQEIDDILNSDVKEKVDLRKYRTNTRTLFKLIAPIIESIDNASGKLSLYAYFLNKSDFDMLSFLANIENYEEAIEDIKIDIEDYPIHQREIIENMVDYEIRDRLNTESIEELLPSILNEYESYKYVNAKVPKNNSFLKEIIDSVDNAKYIKANPYLNIEALRRSLENLPTRIEDVFVDFNDTLNSDIYTIDNADISDIESISDLGKLSTKQVYDFYPLTDTDKEYSLISDNAMTSVFNAYTQSNLYDVFKLLNAKTEKYFTREENPDEYGVYIPSVLYFHRDKDGSLFKDDLLSIVGGEKKYENITVTNYDTTHKYDKIIKMVKEKVGAL